MRVDNGCGSVLLAVKGKGIAPGAFAEDDYYVASAVGEYSGCLDCRAIFLHLSQTDLYIYTLVHSGKKVEGRGMPNPFGCP